MKAFGLILLALLALTTSAVAEVEEMTETKGYWEINTETMEPRALPPVEAPLWRAPTEEELTALENPGQEVPVFNGQYQRIDFWHSAPRYDQVVIYDGKQVKTIAKTGVELDKLEPLLYVPLALVAIALMLLPNVWSVVLFRKLSSLDLVICSLLTFFATLFAMNASTIAYTNISGVGAFGTLGTSMGFFIGFFGLGILLTVGLGFGRKKAAVVCYWMTSVVFHTCLLTLLFGYY